jgi:hypothetical protein
MSAEDAFCKAGSSCERSPCDPDATCVPASFCLRWTCFRCSRSRVVGVCSTDADCPDGHGDGAGDSKPPDCIHQYVCDPKIKRVAVADRAPAPQKTPAPILLSVLPKRELASCVNRGCPAGQLCLPLSLCVGEKPSGSEQDAAVVGSCEHDARCPEQSTCIRRFRCVNPKLLRPTREGKPVTAAPSQPGKLPEAVKQSPGPR